MSQTAKRTVQQAFRLFGLDLHRYVARPPHDLYTLLELYGVDTMFDVGANAGMSGQYFRNVGFKGKIVSFEPVGKFYRQLAQLAETDALWVAENVALGDTEGEQEINVSGGCGGASSFLEGTGHIERYAPELSVVARERVKVETLRSAIRKHYPTGDRLFLKLDAQGYEKRILESAGEELSRVVGMRIEMSVAKCYEGEPLICDMLPYLYGLGFQLCAIEEAWSNSQTHEVYQLDAGMFRTERLTPA